MSSPPLCYTGSVTRTLCPRFHRAIELVGGRWTGAVLQLLLGGPARFAELRASIPQISDRMLAERLQELEQEGILSRAVLPTSPVRVEYTLTQKGRELQRSLEAISVWAEKWVPVDPAPARRPAGPPAARPARGARSAARATRATGPRSSRS